ncbi:SUA5-domain-containing protein [Dacryopinax primogenitus]|uniref:Threonylcarbamoyl-AMP synthase n=1 Tax=Dacryopinax primogenitus (strain DJM 731) TaxID=1858805 RepID=M5GC68_DACPD|nr:SUA5-domain-containing protein [Dacryopinax primogenitus]EJU06624.1 SUA5-domain-containing protein [Dacryopinax primogenitus]
MPSHPIARAVISLSHTPLAAPSANASGRPSPTRAQHVLTDLGGKIPLILDGGACDVGVESTVVDGLSSPGVIKVLRPGGLTVEELQRVLGPGTKVLVHKRDYEDPEIEHVPTTPGMKYRHYSPTTPVVLLLRTTPPEGKKAESIHDILDELHDELSPQQEDFRVGVLAFSNSPITLACITTHYHTHRYSLGNRNEPSEAAHRLFDGLLTLDAEGVDIILVEGVEEDREGLAVMNRLRKAAGEVRYIWG